jgi:hypothetical protein
MRGLVLGAFLLGTIASAHAQTGGPVQAAEMRELVEAARATAKAAQDGAESARIVPDILTQILAKLDKIENKLDKVENAIKREPRAKTR